jgi:hypothetical protein
MKPIQFLTAMTKTDELRAYMTENAAEVGSILEIDPDLVPPWTSTRPASG